MQCSEPFHNFIPTHIQNPFIFMKIGKPYIALEIQNPGQLTILEYSEPWHIHENRPTLYNPGNSELWYIDIPGMFRVLKYLKPDIYSEPSQRFKMKCFVKIV